MSERIQIAPVGGGAVFETGTVTVSAQSSRDMADAGAPIDWQASGSIVQVWLANEHYAENFQPGFVIDIDARSAHGNARFLVVARAVRDSQQVSSQSVRDSQTEFETKDLTTTFADRSMLFVNLKDGWFPIRSDPAVFHLDIAGGTRRYEGAGGHLTCTFRGFRFGNFCLLLVETGTIAGNISW